VRVAAIGSAASGPFDGHGASAPERAAELREELRKEDRLHGRFADARGLEHLGVGEDRDELLDLRLELREPFETRSKSGSAAIITANPSIDASAFRVRNASSGSRST
jgi:hypothetical protein